MENAGTSVAEFMRLRFPHLDRRRIVVFCGKGNNGGDGFVVARKLREMGSKPTLYLLAAPEEMRGDAAVNRDRWTECGGDMNGVANAEALAAAKEALGSAGRHR